MRGRLALLALRAAAWVAGAAGLWLRFGAPAWHTARVQALGLALLLLAATVAGLYLVWDPGEWRR